MKPHKAIININFAVYPIDPTGEINGRSLSRKQIRDANVRPKIIEIKGTTEEECLTLLKEKLESFK
jgi:hypothetical protein